MNIKCVFCDKYARIPDELKGDFKDGSVPFLKSTNLCESAKTNEKFIVKIEITEATGYVCPECFTKCLLRIAIDKQNHAADLCAGVGLNEERDVL